MILFREGHVAPILRGEKTQTRRVGGRRWKVGSVHQCYTRPPFSQGGAKPFCEVRITDVRHEPLRGLSHADALAEGYATPTHYYAAFAEIYGMAAYEAYLDQPLWVVEFELAGDE